MTFGAENHLYNPRPRSWEEKKLTSTSSPTKPTCRTPKACAAVLPLVSIDFIPCIVYVAKVSFAL